MWKTKLASMKHPGFSLSLEIKNDAAA